MNQLPFFVYGTLLPNQPNYPLWSKAIAHSRPALFLNGWLYDMGGYPMLIEGRKGLIYGRVVDIQQEQYPTILNRLDILEGIRPEKTPAETPYRRASRTVVTEEGQMVESWVYLGHPGYISGRELIPGGSWQKYTETRREQIESFWQNHNSF